MKQKNIQTGALVQLQAGGPLMRVRAISQHHAYCVWSEGDVQRHGTFDVATLRPAGPDAEAADVQDMGGPPARSST